MTGLVQFYNQERGFGIAKALIGMGENAPSIFFHRSAIIGLKRGAPLTLPKGTEISFKLVRGDRGPQAADVTIRRVRGDALQRVAERRMLQSEADER